MQKRLGIAAALLVLLAACGDRKPRATRFQAPEPDPRLTVTLMHGNNSRPYMPWPEDVAKQVAAALERVGFVVEVRKAEWNTYLQDVQNGRHQMALLGWSADIADADNFLYVLLDKDNARVGSANNISFYTSEEVHERLTKAREINDTQERMRLYSEAQAIIAKEAPMVPIVYGEKMHAHRAIFGQIPVEPVTHPVLRRVTKPKDHVLVYLRGNDSVGLDPGDITDGESSKVVEQIFDQLLRFKPGTWELEPALATSWSHNEAHTEWTFKIRAGVTFHDGTALDGAAVAGAFERQRDPEHPHHFDDGTYAYWKDLFKFVERVAVGADPMEVVFHCNKPTPPFFLAMLAAFNTSIPSPASLDKYGKDFRRHPVGTGPFVFERWKSGVEIALKRNDAYWDGAPALGGVRFLVSETPTVRSQRLIAAEEADFIDNLDLQTLPRLEEDPEIQVVRIPGLNVCYLSMNNTMPPFDNPLVRQAVAKAIDKERIFKMAYKGIGEVATTPVPPRLPGHDASIPSGDNDPAGAVALLKQAGYLGGADAR